MFAKMFGMVSKSAFEKWLGRLSLAGLIWNSGIFIYLVTSNLPTKHPEFKTLIILLCGYTVVLLSFMLAWSKLIGRSELKKFLYLKISTVLWIIVCIITIATIGPAIMAAIFIANFLVIYFLLSGFETYASSG